MSAIAMIGDSLPPLSGADLPSLQRAIQARLREFDIASLLDLLATMGYRPADVHFRGHLTESPQPTLLHHIEFTDSGVAAERGRPRALVTITVNLGLLSCRSPLPSYFQQLLRDPSFHEPLTELLEIIDDRLLRTRLTSARPELVVTAWDEITSDMLRLFALDSLIGLSWLFRHVFPELPSTVVRTSDRIRVPYPSARLGSSELGIACLGPVTLIDLHDFAVTLRCDEALMRPGLPWVHEVERRLRTAVFPTLEPVSMTLTIILELGDDRTIARLHHHHPGAEQSYLGMAPMLAAPLADDVPRPPRRVTLHRGLLPHDQASTDEVERAVATRDTRITVGRSPADTELRGSDDDPDCACDLALELTLGGLPHHYQARVRWRVRAWFADEPHAIELRSGHVIQAAPTADRHPRLWQLLRDAARTQLATALAATLPGDGASFGQTVADLIAHRRYATLHALVEYGDRDAVPDEAWARFVGELP